MPSVIAVPVEGHKAEKSVAGMISTPITSVALIALQVAMSREYIPVTDEPPPKVLHPGVSTSWMIGQTEVLFKEQFNNIFPNNGIPEQSTDELILIISMFTTNDVMDGLLMPHGRIGGSKLCK